MKYKHIEAAREARLWIGQIFVPLVTVGLTLMSIPEVRNNVLDQAVKAKGAVDGFIGDIKERIGN